MNLRPSPVDTNRTTFSKPIRVNAFNVRELPPQFMHASKGRGGDEEEGQGRM